LAGIAVGIAVTAGGCREKVTHVVIDAAPPGTTPDKTGTILYPTAPGSFVDLIEDARYGVVSIRAAAPVKSGPAAMYPGTPESASDVALGTGFLVEHNSTTFALTSNRIASASNNLVVVLTDGREGPAKIIGRDDRLDVALLSLDLPRVHGLPLGDSDQLKVGEWVVVLGNPFGEEVTASAGIVSATGRNAAASFVASKAMSYRMFLQLDARVHRGNGGGPVLDTAGTVVGIAVATGDRPSELSFAAPITRVKEVLSALHDYGTVFRSWLGVLVKPITPELVAQHGLPGTTGALVTEVKPASPAVRAGLRVGDVIRAWDGAPIDQPSFQHVVSNTPVGKHVSVTVWRSGGEVTIDVVTEKMPE
jgi:serine protease Do